MTTRRESSRARWTTKWIASAIASRVLRCGSRKLQAGDTRELLNKRNTVFMLESLLQRFVYGRPLDLKRDPTIRGAVLTILDMLVENGSSAAFRMRDDFVTPAA